MHKCSLAKRLDSQSGWPISECMKLKKSIPLAGFALLLGGLCFAQNAATKSTPGTASPASASLAPQDAATASTFDLSKLSPEEAKVYIESFEKVQENPEMKQAFLEAFQAFRRMKDTRERLLREQDPRMPEILDKLKRARNARVLDELKKPVAPLPPPSAPAASAAK